MNNKCSHRNSFRCCQRVGIKVLLCMRCANASKTCACDTSAFLHFALRWRRVWELCTASIALYADASDSCGEDSICVQKEESFVLTE